MVKTAVDMCNVFQDDESKIHSNTRDTQLTSVRQSFIYDPYLAMNVLYLKILVLYERFYFLFVKLLVKAGLGTLRFNHI